MSFYCSVNGGRIISASISIPTYGTWVADLVLSVSTALAPEDVLQVGDLSLTGFVKRAFSFAGSRSARMAGGYGGWQKMVPSKVYNLATGIPLAMVLGDVATEVGEQINVPASLNATIGGYFVRQSAPAARVLRQLVPATSSDGLQLWWVDPTGVTQITSRSSAPITSPFEVINWSGGKGKFEVATEKLGDWMPGRTFSSPVVSSTQTISETRIDVDNNGKLRLLVLTTP